MNLFSPKWWVSMMIQTFIIMIFIYLIKGMTDKYKVPVVSNIAQGV